MKFLFVKKKTIIAVLLCVLVIGMFCEAYFPVRATFAPKPVHTIVIDAGHGGLMSRKDSILKTSKRKSISN